jgi:hypothetical protein
VQYQASQPGLHGLGAEAETILTTANPVDLYIRAIQALISTLPEYHTVGTTAPSKTIESNGKWDFRTHMGVIDFLASIYGVEDTAKFPAWGQDPGFMAFFIVEMFMGGFELDRAWDKMRPFYEALGLPTGSMREAISSFTSPGNAQRMRVVFDRVIRYVIGSEGGRAYGDPMTTYKGIGSAAGAPLLSLLLIALL